MQKEIKKDGRGRKRGRIKREESIEINNKAIRDAKKVAVTDFTLVSETV